jgi:hypothetical protein
MADSFPNELIIQASRFGPVMTARQSIERAKTVLLDLEQISPWRPPFSVSGCTAATGDMPIAEDLSDFDEVVMRALQSYTNFRYYNDGDPENLKLTPDSKSPFGFETAFSDERQRKEYRDRISVSLQSSGMQDQVSLDDSVYMIEIRASDHGQANAGWANPSVVYGIFNYFIDEFDPLHCKVFSTSQLTRIRTSESNYGMGWLNYTRDPKVADVFYNTGKAVPYRNGVLLKFGDDASALFDPKVDQELIEIRKTLRSVGVTV